MSLTADDLLEEVTEVIRDAPPSHYSFNIQCFSQLSSNSIQKYESCIFEVGEYKWKLLLHPKGDSTRNVDDHVSLYLVIAETSSLPAGWEVNVIYRFFMFDQIRDKYLTLGDAGGRVRRFHGIRHKWGFSRLISLATFIDPGNGYLVDDSCEFGVEILIVRNAAQSECLTMLNTTSSYCHSWKVENFSLLMRKAKYPDIFVSGDHKLKIGLWPKGSGDGRNNSLSLYLCSRDSDELLGQTKVYARFRMRLRNQTHGKHLEKTTHYWFKDSGGWGWPKFINLEKFKDPTKGYLVNNACIVEVEVTVLGSRKRNE